MLFPLAFVTVFASDGPEISFGKTIIWNNRILYVSFRDLIKNKDEIRRAEKIEKINHRLNIGYRREDKSNRVQMKGERSEVK